MQFSAQQQFTLYYPGPPAQALAWAQQADAALAQVEFLRGVTLAGDRLSGELLVPLPMLGEVDLPFVSRLTALDGGAALTPQPLPERRGWVEVAGEAQVGAQDADSDAEAQAPALPQGRRSLTPVHLRFQFGATLRLPDVPGFGGAAFEKMVRAAAEHTLERVAAQLPGQLQASMETRAP